MILLYSLVVNSDCGAPLRDIELCRYIVIASVIIVAGVVVLVVAPVVRVVVASVVIVVIASVVPVVASVVHFEIASVELVMVALGVPVAALVILVSASLEYRDMCPMGCLRENQISCKMLH